MRTLKITSHSAAQTTRLGESLSKHFHKGDIVCLFGDLGSGKTTFIKGLAKGLRVRASQVNSPTFILMNRYEGKLPLYHFDLYRLDDIKQIGGLGYEEFLYGDGVAVIEWAEKLKDLMPESYLGIYLSHPPTSGPAKPNVKAIQHRRKGEKIAMRSAFAIASARSRRSSQSEDGLRRDVRPYLEKALAVGLHVDDHERLIEIKPCGEKYQNFLQSRKVQRK